MDNTIDMDRFLRNNPQIEQIEFDNIKNEVPYQEQTKQILGGDEGLATLFASLVSRKIRLIDKGNGYVWNHNNKLWEYKRSIHIQNSIGRVLSPVISENIQRLKDQDDDDMKDLIKQLKKVKSSLNQSKLGSSIFTKVISKLTVSSDWEKYLNSIDYEFPLKNGKLIDFQTGKVRTRTIDDLWTFESKVSYISGDLPDIDDYMMKLTVQDREYANFLQKLMGYNLTGEIDDRSLYLAHGIGKNGKTILFDNIMKDILGPFWVSLNTDIFLTIRKGGATPELMPLQYARMGVINETDDGYINGKMTKTLTGGDTINARALYKDEIQFKNKAKITIVSNKKLDFDSNDQAVVDRIKFLPFNARFEPTDNESKALKTWISKNIDRFFSYFANGAIRWYNDKNLALPNVARKATEQRCNENNSYKNFLDDRCELDESYRLKGSIARSEYETFCADEKIIKPLSSNEFGALLIKQFGKKDAHTNCYKGLRIKVTNLV